MRPCGCLRVLGHCSSFLSSLIKNRDSLIIRRTTSPKIDNSQPQKAQKHQKILCASCGYCHLKIFRATTKLTTHQKSSIATDSQLVESDEPSFIKARRTLLSAVSGSA